jgi:tRNA (guanine-N7-)-methyltransferase
MTIDPTPPTLIEAIDGRLDWDGLFETRAPRELEVGSGKGLFLLNAGRRHPEVQFVGIELARKYARRAAERLARNGVANARVIWGDAKRLIAAHVPDGSLRAVHVYFPDPWWKKRHRKRRLFEPGFVDQVARILTPGGRLEVATDVETYLADILALLRGDARFEERAAGCPAEPEHDLDYLTHFERKYRMEGRPIHRARFARSGAPTGEETER